MSNHSAPTIVSATNDHIASAASRLQQGGLVAFPTETVYGLGANATNDEAVHKIFRAKRRPEHNPLIVHCHDVVQLEPETILTPDALALASAFWPGPLTLVLPRAKNCRLSPLVSADGDTVAVRIPGHPVARQLLADAQRLIAAPSANRSGEVSPTSAAHVAASLPDIDALILDGGPCPVGIESTVVDLTALTPIILRPGSITLEMLRPYLPTLTYQASQSSAGGTLRSPGLLTSHYAPNLPVRLNATSLEPGEALLAFGELTGALSDISSPMRNLSPTGNLAEAARSLFRYLRELDQLEVTGIAVMPIPDKDIGLAINDRLRRAAAPRS